ncbi:MAG: succinyl-diaminopimelate desuccinylase [Pseudomonadota bacterium]
MADTLNVGADTAGDAVAHTRALVQCPSVTPAEAGALSYLEDRLDAIGFAAHRLVFSDEGIPDVDNLFARIGTSGPHLCLAGHTDVVPPGDVAAWTYPPFSAEVIDGVMYGRGTADMKGSVAAFLAAAERVVARYEGALPGSLSLLITGDEEAIAVNGTVKVLEWMVANGHAPDHCLVGEPTCTETVGSHIKIGRRGSLTGDLVISGKQGHVAYQHFACNPVPAMLAALSALTNAPLDHGNVHFPASNLEVTTVDIGNPAENIIPARVAATFNVRFNDLHSLASLTEILQRRVDEAVAPFQKLPDLQVDLSFRYSNADAFMTEPGPFIDAMGAAVHQHTGLTPELATSGGTSDARFITKVCPVFEFGPLNATIHQVDERVPVSDLELLCDIYETFIVNYFETFADASSPTS